MHPGYSNKISMFRSLVPIFCYCMPISNEKSRSICWLKRLLFGYAMDLKKKNATLIQQQYLVVKATGSQFLLLYEGPVIGLKVSWLAIKWTYEIWTHPWYSNNISNLRPLALIVCYCMLISNEKSRSIVWLKSLLAGYTMDLWNLNASLIQQRYLKFEVTGSNILLLYADF